jgi:hypothetical protein
LANAALTQHYITKQKDCDVSELKKCSYYYTKLMIHAVEKIFPPPKATTLSTRNLQHKQKYLILLG